MRTLRVISTKAQAMKRMPPRTMYRVPRPDRKKPHTEVPTVVPRFVEARKSPLAKSGAFGAAVASQYWLILAAAPASTPHTKVRTAIGTVKDPRKNSTTYTAASRKGKVTTKPSGRLLSILPAIRFPMILDRPYTRRRILISPADSRVTVSIYSER